MFEGRDITRHTKAIDGIVHKYCEENGLCFEPGTVAYSKASFTYECEIRAKSKSGLPALSTYERLYLEKLLCDAPEEVRNAGDVRGRDVYLLDGKIGTIVAFNADYRKYPWVVKIDGTNTLCDTDRIMWLKGFAK